MIYCDTSYLVRLYVEDTGFESVRELCAQNDIACCVHGRVEMYGALHRQLREGRLTAKRFADLLDQFEKDSDLGGFEWLPFSEHLPGLLASHYRKAPPSCFLRAADALHLACAMEHGLAKIYSNDRHLLAAAPLFGLRGVDVIPAHRSRGL